MNPNNRPSSFKLGSFWFGRLSLHILSGLLLVSALLLATSGCHSTKVKLAAGVATGSLITSNVLSTALPIVNDGSGTAQDVQITSLSMSGTTVAKPALPASLGMIAEDGAATLMAGFSGTFVPGNSYQIDAGGTFRDNGHTFKFAVSQTVQVQAAGPGSAAAGSGSSPATNVNGAHFPHQAPNFPGEVNESGHGWTVPDGPDRPTPTPSTPSGVQPAPQGDPPGIDIETNTSLGFNSGLTPNEPSGAVSGGGIVFETANSYGAYSTNGTSFTKIDPTTIFPNNADGGYCCDQIVQYVQSIDRFVWVMQYWQGSTGLNRYRIAAASPASLKSSGATAWTYWDITSTQVGGGTGWLDYPDTSVGNNYLYLSADLVESKNSGRVVIRIPLSQIQSGSTINFGYTHYTDGQNAYGSHLVQNTLDTGYWAGEPNNTTMRIFSWPESSGNYSWNDVSVGKYAQSGLSSKTPDGQDWMSKLSGFPGNAVLGGARLQGAGDNRKQNELLLAWTAGTGQGFTQPQVQWIALDLNNNYHVLSQQQIWNGSYAFGYPEFLVNSNGEIGMSLEWGGGGNYENHVVGFWGDYVVYATTGSNIGTGRYGDYVTIRPYPNDLKRFAAFGYGNQKTTGYDTKYVVFSRPGQ
jgi:hypothetical protein